MLDKLPPRFRVWRLVANKKPPVGPDGRPLPAWQEPPFLNLAQARLHASGPGAANGIGFVPGEGVAVGDVDGCFGDDGQPVSDNARRVVLLLRSCGGWTETSVSGRGMHVVFRGPRGFQVSFKAKPEGEVLEAPVFLAMTERDAQGDPTAELPGLADAAERIVRPLTEGVRPEKPKSRFSAAVPPDGGTVAPGGQNYWLVGRAWMHACRGLAYEDVIAQLRVDVKRCPAEEGRRAWSEGDLDNIARRATARAPAEDEKLLTDEKGAVLQNEPDNVRRAFKIIKWRPRLDRFSGNRVIEAEDGERRRIDDELVNRLWLDFVSGLRFRPPLTLFTMVLYDMAARDDFHPVRDYFKTVRWDGTPRVGSWLVTYGAAADTPYVRAVGQLFLVAAVRRIVTPGSKFDELLVLESPQGWDKSRALRALCPQSSWFSETLPLGAETKVVIERTVGAWIVEAAEMVNNARDADHLKAFLSTQTDGPVRLAYAREPVSVPRQFVVVATTNRSNYLLDSTGNRRFWPVNVGRMDVDAIARDRDQLWAEAVTLEAMDEPTRLARELWPDAEEEQEARRVADPWEDLLEADLGSLPGKVLAGSLWGVVGLVKDKREHKHSMRIGAIMKRLGFKHTRFRRGRTFVWGYVRGGPYDALPWLIKPLGEEDEQIGLRDPGEEG